MHGAAVHAAFFDWLRTLDPEYATRLHDDTGTKPFTISLLHAGTGDPTTTPSATGQIALTPDAAYWLRITALEPRLGMLLHRLFRSPPPHITLLGQVLSITGLTVSPDVHQWAQVSTYDELHAAALRQPVARIPKIRLRFVSPTTFRANGQSQPLPLPDLVWGSLVARWNAFNTQPLPADVGAFVRQAVSISAYDMRTEMVAMEGSRREAKWVCFRGWCEYSATSDDPDMIGWWRTLADYAFFAGVGYKTTMGFGQVYVR